MFSQYLYSIDRSFKKHIVYIKKKKKQRKVHFIHEVNLRFLSSFFYNKLRPIFCNVGTPSTRKAHEMKIDNMGRWFFSYWSTPLWKKTPSTPDRRRTYGILNTSPDALPLSYRIFFGARDTKLGLRDKHPAILLLGSQSKNIF